MLGWEALMFLKHLAAAFTAVFSAQGPGPVGIACDSFNYIGREIADTGGTGWYIPESLDLARLRPGFGEPIFVKDYEAIETGHAESLFRLGSTSSMTLTPLSLCLSASKEAFEQTSGGRDRELGLVLPIILAHYIVTRDLSADELQNLRDFKGGLEAFAMEILESRFEDWEVLTSERLACYTRGLVTDTLMGLGYSITEVQRFFRKAEKLG